MNKPKIFIACDTTNTKKINQIIDQSQTNKLEICLKLGLEFFLSPKGRGFMHKLKNKEIFLDLKLNDIISTIDGGDNTTVFLATQDIDGGSAT